MCHHRPTVCDITKPAQPRYKKQIDENQNCLKMICKQKIQNYQQMTEPQWPVVISYKINKANKFFGKYYFYEVQT